MGRSAQSDGNEILSELVILIAAISLLAYAIAGALTYRLRGGGFFPLPGLVRRSLAALLICLPIWALVDWWLALGVLGATMAVIPMGHGAIMDFGRTDKGRL